MTTGLAGNVIFYRTTIYIIRPVRMNRAAEADANATINALYGFVE